MRGSLINIWNRNNFDIMYGVNPISLSEKELAQKLLYFNKKELERGNSILNGFELVGLMSIVNKK